MSRRNLPTRSRSFHPQSSSSSSSSSLSSSWHKPRSTTITIMNNRLPTRPQRSSSPTSSSSSRAPAAAAAPQRRRMAPSRAYSSPLASMQTSLNTNNHRESSLSPPTGSRKIGPRSRSPPTATVAGSAALPSLSSSYSSMDISLRRRSRSPPGADSVPDMLSLSCGSLDCTCLEEEQHLHQSKHHNKNTPSSSRNGSTTSRRSRLFFAIQKNMVSIQKKLHEKAPLLQLLLLIALLFLGIEAHVGGSHAMKQMEDFYEHKSAMLLQLQKVEHHSLHLHQTVGTRLRKAGIIDDDESRDDSLDFDPADETTSNHHQQQQQHPHLKHTSELHQMAQELHMQTAEHKTRLRNEAVDHIHEEYGEGPIKVVLEIEFPPSTLLEEDTSSIEELAIVLYPDTPYASWTWLEQIGRHVWDDAIWDMATASSSSLSTTSSTATTFGMVPSRPDPLGRGQLKFVESRGGLLAPNNGIDRYHHGKWTVGLRSSTEMMTGGQLQMFVNLSDNQQALHSHEVCVGKILDSFGALQRIVELSSSASSKQGGSSDDDQRGNHHSPQVRIKKAHAMHATKRELMSIL